MISIGAKYNLLRNKINSSDIAKRIATGAFWSFTGTAFAKLMVLVAGIYCARLLGKEGYGEFGMVRSTINMFVIFGVAGLGLTATRYISNYKKGNEERICSIYLLTNGFAFITGLIVTISILLLAPFLATNTLNSPYLVNDIRCGALLLFVTVLNGSQNGILAGLEDFRSIAINTLYGSIAESIFMLIGAFYYGIMGAILGYGTGFIVLYVSNQISIRKNFKKLNIKIRLSDFKIKDLHLLYKFSLPAALSSLMVSPVYWIIRSMLVRINGYGDLATYEVADQWKVMILFVPTAISQIILPILSSIVGVNEAKFWKVLKLNLIINVGITSIAVLLVCLLSKYIINLYGTDFTNNNVIIILSLSTIFSVASNIIGLSISSREKMWIGFCFNFFWAVMVICFTYYFINQGMGASGIALAILCSYVIHFILQYIYLRQITIK